MQLMKWFSLRWSTFFIIAITFLGLIVVLLGSLNSLLPSYFQEQEEAAARQSALRGKAVLSAALDELDRAAASLPEDFVPLAESSNALLVTHNAHIIGRFQLATSTFRGRILPSGAEESILASPEQITTIEEQLSGLPTASMSWGMLRLDNTAFLAVFGPLNDEYAILLARRLDGGALDKLSTANLTALRLIDCRSPVQVSDQASLCGHVSAGDQPYILARTSEQMESYLPLEGLDGEMAYALQVSSGRLLYNSGGSVLNILTIALTASAVIFAIMTLLFIRWFIIRRLSQLNKDVQAIADQSGALRRVGSSGRDEIARLGGNINIMLDKLEATQHELGKSYEQVRQGRKLLEELSHRLVEVQEEERRSIAMELHDEIGQALTALKLQLASRKSNLTAKKTDEARLILDGLIGRVRELSLQLRPAMLDDLGLLPTLVWFCELFTKQAGIQVNLAHSGLEGRRFPSELEITAFRLVQESLTNIARHADVRVCEVKVDANRSKLTLDISDKGKGFDTAGETASEMSAGISGMRERVLMRGGKFSLDSSPRKGTRITAELPIKGVLERRGHER